MHFYFYFANVYFFFGLLSVLCLLNLMVNFVGETDITNAINIAELGHHVTLFNTTEHYCCFLKINFNTMKHSKLEQCFSYC